MNEYTAIFFTHSGAIKFDRFCKKNDITSELMPVPRKLSSNCGICSKFCYDNKIDNLISDEIEKIYETNANEYILRYEE